MLTEPKSSIENIQGLKLVTRGRYGYKFVVGPPSKYDPTSAGSITAVDPDRPNLREEVYYESPEHAAKETRLEWERLIQERVVCRDANNMWGVVADNRDEMIGALRLLRAGIDLNAPLILKAIKPILENR